MIKKLVISFILLLASVFHIKAEIPEAATPLPPPTGNIISVSTWNELINAVWNLESYSTIVIQPGEYIIPEWWFINVGIHQNQPIDHVTIRGATGKYDDVVIKGAGGGMNGATPFGFFINNASNVTIADLTMGEVYHHAVQLNPPTIGGADGIRLYHCRFYDCGEQIIKGNFLYDENGLPVGVKNGSIEYCLIEYTSWGPADGYTEGIDLHAAENWTIQHNLLRNIRVPLNLYHTHVPAILIWNNSRNINVISNTFVNCDRGIAYGLVDRTYYLGYPEVHTGIIANNMIFRQSDSVVYNDAGILAWDVREVKILNNSVYDEVLTYPPIEYRFVKDSSNIVIMNNLINPTSFGNEPPIWDRDNDGGSPANDYQNATVINNYTTAQQELFLRDYPGDLHLNPAFAEMLSGISTHQDCTDDFDRMERGLTTTFGADHTQFYHTATHSFTNYNGGTYPFSIAVVGNLITIDLTAIEGAEIYRAVFNPGRNFNYYNLTENPIYSTTMKISYAGAPLDLLPPRFNSFDAGTASTDALNNGSILLLTVEVAGAGLGSQISLNVMCDLPLPQPIPKVTQAFAKEINGSAFITFQEVDSPIQEDNPTYATFYDAYQNVKNGQVRYRIYRSDQPFTSSATLRNAELIDEIYPLSGWNPKLDGPERVFPFQGQTGTVTRFPVDDGVIAPLGCGIYVQDTEETFRGDSSYYFISHTIDGAEDFSSIVMGENATNGIALYMGSGVTMLAKTEQRPDFIYEGPTTLHYYVKWESPPAAVFPNEASSYLVAFRDDIDYSSFDPGVIIKLHAWGGNLKGGYGWWHYADQGHLLVAANQFPWQSWWAGHHSCFGSLRSHQEGTVQPFTPHRILDFVFDFLKPVFHIDENKIVLSGSSMGGTGASLTGIRNGQVFSNLIGWVGVHNPANSPIFQSSFENAFGDSSWHCLFSNVDFTQKYSGVLVTPEDSADVWEYFNNSLWIGQHPSAELPWHTFSNGVNDGQIGWPQALDYILSSADMKLPVNITWGMNGHSQRARVLAPYGYETDRKSQLVFRKNQSFPVFCNAAMNGNPLTETEGHINNYFCWDTESIVDTIDLWEASVRLIPSSSINSTTADVVPRRLQQFKVLPGTIYLIHYLENGTLISSDTIIAEELGFLTITNLEIVKEYRKIVIKPVTTNTLNIPSGWSGISSYLMPFVADIETLFEPLIEQLIILQNLNGFYWPDQNLNTLDNWNYQSGYIVKLNQSHSFTIYGNNPLANELMLTQGWNLIPVLSRCAVPVNNIFNQIGANLVLIKETAGNLVFWPSLDIHTLQFINPGKSYFLLTTTDCTIVFPECEE